MSTRINPSKEQQTNTWRSFPSSFPNSRLYMRGCSIGARDQKERKWSERGTFKLQILMNLSVNRPLRAPWGHSSIARLEKCAANVVVLFAGEVLTFPCWGKLENKWEPSHISKESQSSTGLLLHTSLKGVVICGVRLPICRCHSYSFCIKSLFLHVVNFFSWSVRE